MAVYTTGVIGDCYCTTHSYWNLLLRFIKVERQGIYMKKNSNPFPKAFILIVIVFCIVEIVDMVHESKTCIMKGCDYYRMGESKYCYIHQSSRKKSTSSGTSSYGNQSSGSSSSSASSKSSSKSSSSSSTGTSGSSSKSSTGSSSYSKKSTSGNQSSYSSGTKKSSSYKSYDDGYDDIYMDGDYDDERYRTDQDYADGVDDAMDEFDGDW